MTAFGHSYPQTDVFLICFRVTQRAVGFRGVALLPRRAVSHCRQPNRPEGRGGVGARELARELGAAKYVECSALTLNVFKEAIIAQPIRCVAPPVVLSRS
ncbi:hypothetical protein K438DRAFT_923779 [Mycena galopus ATCC 62051]|nr:hypothetical protein K438DRAFT_923779 [Mycena galopus ATCC 62051]